MFSFKSSGNPLSVLVLTGLLALTLGACADADKSRAETTIENTSDESDPSGDVSVTEDEDVADEDGSDDGDSDAGAEADTDADDDGVENSADNCPADANADQADLDADASGDTCDTDDDGDGTSDNSDAFPTDPAESADADGDGFGDNADNCAATANAEQTDTDADGLGDACDNCAAASNAEQDDADADGEGDVCDADADGDGHDGTTAGGDDCDDADATIYAGATEFFDFEDDDCDGNGDENLSLLSADLDFEGESANDNLGYETAYAGDVNGDGYGDILVGAPYDDDAGTNAGKAYLIFGSASLSGDLEYAAAGITFAGETANDNFGVALAAAGDVNGDGYGDVLVGATLNDAGGTSAGKAYLFYGRDFALGESVSAAEADATFIGENAYDNFGVSVDGLGDVNADGYGDLVVGASGYDNDAENGAGKAYLFFGGDLSGAYDLGSVAADAAFVGENASDQAGKTVAAAGDIDNDGRSDILVGAPQNDAGGANAGQVYLILGAAALSGTLDLSEADAAFTGEAAGDLAGSALAGGADVNADGYDDILAGAYENDGGGAGAGKAYVIFGSDTPSSLDLDSADASFSGKTAGDRLGFAVNFAGDMDGDGDAEIVLGAYKNDDAGADAGKVYVVKGDAALAGSLEANAGFTGETAGDQAGYSAAAGDVSGDGLSNLFVGANGFDLETGLNGGKFYLYYAH